MTIFKNLKTVASNRFVQAGVLLSFAGSASAAGEANSMESSITNAITAGQANVSMTIAGVVAVAALCFGAGLIISWLRK
ncbi:MAG: hypothetical protein ACRC9O_02230 [Plesiomonas sp.]|uniref:hypothetical protein n=1 Tax=Plesiomonas sp. TaxID=2486279 RepID=UPI003F36258B